MVAVQNKELLFSVTKNDLEVDWFSGTGWDGDGCPCYLEYYEIDCGDLYTDVLEFLFEDLSDGKGHKIISTLTGDSYDEDEEAEE